jgi:putative ubiquitin-RnfH superfamily antitoxin RatB of RatAB toxin-antitoxin module
MASAEPSTLRVSVAYSPAPRQVEVVPLSLPLGSTVQDALHASGLLERYALGEASALSVGVWMKLQPLQTPLRSDDRVEIYRPLQVDPKEARRQRYRKQTPAAR